MCISILGPLATLLVGCGVGFIAWQQWKVSHDKLRLDLFDRRYKVFDSTRIFLSVILKNARFDDSQFFEFCAGISDVEFLFGKDVVDYLTQIRTKALDARAHHEALETIPVGDERSRRVNAKQNDILWLGEQINVISGAFAPYLNFTNIK
jgi:hypothetical protein